MIHRSLLATIKINVFYFISYLIQYGLATEMASRLSVGSGWLAMMENSNTTMVAITIGVGTPLTVVTGIVAMLAVGICAFGRAAASRPG